MSLPNQVIMPADGARTRSPSQGRPAPTGARRAPRSPSSATTRSSCATPGGSARAGRSSWGPARPPAVRPTPSSVRPTTTPPSERLSSMAARRLAGCRRSRRHPGELRTARHKLGLRDGGSGVMELGSASCALPSDDRPVDAVPKLGGDAFADIVRQFGGGRAARKVGLLPPRSSRSWPPWEGPPECEPLLPGPPLVEDAVSAESDDVR